MSIIEETLGQVCSIEPGGFQEENPVRAALGERVNSVAAMRMK